MKKMWKSKRVLATFLVTFMFIEFTSSSKYTIYASQKSKTDSINIEKIYSPKNLREAPASATDKSVVLIWEKPLEYSNIVGYKIYSDNKIVGETDRTYYKVEGLDENTSHKYIVKSYDASGHESKSSKSITIKTEKTGKTLNVKDYGATGSGNTKDTVAIQKAIDACPKGGTVLLPEGKYLSGALFLHDDMTFYVAQNAKLIPSSDLKDYPWTSARHDIEDIYNPNSTTLGNPAFASLLNAGKMDHTKGATTHNIKIMGEGTIGDETNGLNLRTAYDAFCADTVNNKAAHYGGGSLISFKNCSNVYMDGIHIRNGMMWTIVPVYSSDITSYNLDITTTVHNGDGFDPNSSTNVYILENSFSTGDDCSAIKSGKDAEGREIGRPSKDIYYRGCVFNAGHGGITLGSEMSGGISDVFAEDCTLVPVELRDSSTNSGIRVKVSPSRGGYIKNIQVRDSICNKISVITNYDKQSGPTPGVSLPDISNFQFTNLKVPQGDSTHILDLNGSNFGSSISYLKDLQFTNCNFYQGNLNSCENVFFNNCTFKNGITKTNSVNIQQLSGNNSITTTGISLKANSIDTVTVSAVGGSNLISSKGGTLQLKAAVLPDNVNDKSVKWSVCNTDFSQNDAAQISSNGLLTAKKNGEVIAVATSNFDSSIKGILPIKITGQENLKKIKTVKVLATVGIRPTLPSIVYAVYDDDSVSPMNVTWDKFDELQYKQEGSFEVKGIVPGTNHTAKAKVQVKKNEIKDIPSVVVKTTSGSLSLPGTVNVFYNDGSEKQFPVVWDKVDSSVYANVSVNGFRVYGNVKEISKKVCAEVSVLPVKSGSDVILVAADGTGDFKTIKAAVAAVPADNKKEKIIFVKNGVYHEKLVINRPYVTLVGESSDGTRITNNDSPMKNDSNGNALGTYNDYTMQVTGNDFTAKNITIENSAGSTVGQSVAVDLIADRARFFGCKFLGYQDTLLTRNKTDSSTINNPPSEPTIQTYRSYFKNCQIAGSVDFIFGAGKSIFDNCDIHSRLNGYLTAACTPQQQKYGYVFLNCKLTCESLLQLNKSVYLGRPWRPYSSVVYLNCSMDQHINIQGWNNWGNAANEQTAKYSEYNSIDLSGKPLDLSKRVSWETKLAKDQVVQYTVTNVLGDFDNWNPLGY